MTTTATELVDVSRREGINEIYIVVYGGPRRHPGGLLCRTS